MIYFWSIWSINCTASRQTQQNSLNGLNNGQCLVKLTEHYRWIWLQPSTVNQTDSPVVTAFSMAMPLCSRLFVVRTCQSFPSKPIVIFRNVEPTAQAAIWARGSETEVTQTATYTGSQLQNKSATVQRGQLGHDSSNHPKSFQIV